VKKADERRWRQNERRWKQNEKKWKENEKRWEEAYKRFDNIERRLSNVESTLGAMAESQHSRYVWEDLQAEIRARGEALMRRVRSARSIFGLIFTSTT